MRRSRRALVLVPFLLSACMTWKRHDPPAVGAAPALSGDHRVRVTRADRSMIVLNGAQVVGDSLVGSVGEPPQRVAVALTDVAQVEERRLSALRTTGVVAGGFLVLTAVLTVAAFVALMGSIE